MIAKNKIMLQIPVEKDLAETWRKFVKMTGKPQEFIFGEMFSDFLENLYSKINPERKKENAKS